MKTIFKLNNKKVTKKYLVACFGEARVNNMVQQAKEQYQEDPFVQNDFFCGAMGVLTIEFQF